MHKTLPFCSKNSGAIYFDYIMITCEKIPGSPHMYILHSGKSGNEATAEGLEPLQRHWQEMGDSVS